MRGMSYIRLRWTTVVTVLVLGFLLFAAMNWPDRPEPKPAVVEAQDVRSETTIADEAGPDGEGALDPGALPVATAKFEFLPEELIDNPNCDFAAGLGPASDTAVYVLSESGRNRFAILDGQGTVFGGELPFDPNHYRVGKRTDGSVVAALADLRLNSRVFRPPHAPEPIRIYRDGQIVYENEKVWDFDVASDGSSFYVIEPLAGDASRLVVHNLDARQEHHYDLGAEFNPYDAYESPYVSLYSTTNTEVMFWPPQELNDTPRGDYWFYPTDGGGPRVVRIESSDIRRNGEAAANVVDVRMVRVESILHGGLFRSVKDRVYFASSEEAYHLVDKRSAESGSFEVVKREYRGYGDEAGPQRRDAWTHAIPASHVGLMVLSDNGAWLALDAGQRTWAFDADTGELVFAFPSTEDVSLRIPQESWYEKVPGGDLNLLQQAWGAAALVRLRGVLGPEATVDQVGSLGGVGFRGNWLMLYRSVGRGARARQYYDVFDLATAEIDSPPEFRVEADHGCAAGDFVRGLQKHDGRLTYLNTRRQAQRVGGTDPDYGG